MPCPKNGLRRNGRKIVADRNIERQNDLRSGIRVAGGKFRQTAADGIRLVSKNVDVIKHADRVKTLDKAPEHSDQRDGGGSRGHELRKLRVVAAEQHSDRENEREARDVIADEDLIMYRLQRSARQNLLIEDDKNAHGE